MIERTERFELRVDKELLDKLDVWRGHQADLPSRSEAMRRLAATALENSPGQQLYELTRFKVLTASLTRGPAERLTDAYVFAWDHGVYPWSDMGAKLHIPFKNQFPITESMGLELSKYLDDRWMAKEVPTFYELEEHYGVRLRRSNWDRSALISSCRYMFLRDLFDREFWKSLLKSMQHPAEAGSICRKYKRDDDLYLL